MSKTYDIMKQLVDRQEQMIHTFTLLLEIEKKKFDYQSPALAKYVAEHKDLIAKAKEHLNDIKPSPAIQQWMKGEAEAQKHYNPPTNKPRG